MMAVLRYWLRFSLVLPFLVHAAALHAQETPSSPSVPFPAWEIHRGDSSAVLIGSLHALAEKDLDLTAAEAFSNQADVLILEADLGAFSTAEIQSLTASRGILPKEQSLSQHLSPSAYARIEDLAQHLKVPMAGLERLRPWLLTLTLASRTLQTLGISPEQGLDAFFYRRAVNQGKPVLGLEDASEQIALFADLPQPLQEQMLLHTLEKLQRMQQQAEALNLAWKTANLPALERFLLQSFESYPELYHRVVVERNHRWAHRLETLLSQKKSVLVVVGVAHLVGPDSLTSLLRKRGFLLEKI